MVEEKIETKTVKLSSGYDFPLFGLGTWKSDKGKVSIAVYEALKAGYKHIDCAAVYGNEVEVGQGLKKAFDEGIVKREDIFITSKLWTTEGKEEDVEPAIKKTLKELGLKYLDLYLYHWPILLCRDTWNNPKDPKNFFTKTKIIPYPLSKTWGAMEKLVEAGLTRSIGVSNVNGALLNQIIGFAKIKPAVNQIELNPYLQQPNLTAFCKYHNVHITAYSPLCNPGNRAERKEENLLDDKVLVKIGKENKKTAAQIAIQWSYQKGYTVIPKTVTPKRLVENLKSIGGDELTKEQMKEIKDLDKNLAFCQNLPWGLTEKLSVF